MRSVASVADVARGEGGKLTFSAYANWLMGFSESRHLTDSSTGNFSAPPHGGREPSLPNAALRTNFRFSRGGQKRAKIKLGFAKGLCHKILQ